MRRFSADGSLAGGAAAVRLSQPAATLGGACEDDMRLWSSRRLQAADGAQGRYHHREPSARAAFGASIVHRRRVRCARAFSAHST